MIQLGSKDDGILCAHSCLQLFSKTSSDTIPPQVSRADRISLSPVWSNWLLSPAGAGGGGGAGAGPSRSRSEKPARSKQRVTTKLA